MTRKRHPIAAICLAAALSTVAPGSAAEPSDEDRAAAQALFEEAQALKKDEKFEEACEKFADSQKLDPAMGTQLNLADCYERTGRTASAWINFLEVAAEARKAGSERRQQIAEERAEALKPQLSRLQVDVAEPLEGMVVERNGVAISRPKWGSAVPVDPETYELTATAPGMKPWSEIVTVEGEGALVEVIVPTLEAAPLTESSDEVADESSGSGVQIGLGIALSAVGLGGMALGTAFTLIASSKHDDSLQFCPDDPNQCTAPGVALRDEAQSAQTISIVGFAVGGAALVGGVVLLVTGLSGGEGSDEEGAEEGVSLELSPYVSPEVAGFGLSGRF